MTQSVIVNEVGLRDGLQNQPVIVSTADKLRLLSALLDAGVTHVEATSFVNPTLVPQMADAATLYRELPNRDRVEYSALVPNLKGYRRAVEAGARSVNVVLSATETMNKRNINMSLDEAIDACGSVLKESLSDGVRTRAYIAVAFECPYEGPTPREVVLRLADLMSKAGADEIIIADTIGAAAPEAVARLFEQLADTHDLLRLSGHFHDTRGLAAANAYAAFSVGIRRFDASIGGLGGCPFAPGAAGNLATEDLAHLLQAGGHETGLDLEKLEIAVEVAEACIGAGLGGAWLRWRRSQRARRESQRDLTRSA